MQYTLLELTQTILSSMDSDEVNSISDTVESEQVVKVIKTVYNDIVSRSDLELHRVPFNLGASNDTTKPILMYKPSTIKSIDWIKYNVIKSGDTIPVWADMQFVDLETFLHRTLSLNVTETNVDSATIVSDGFTFNFYYRNDVGPSFYTSFNDGTLVFDAFDIGVDSTLQASKSYCYGQKNLSFTESDSFVPVLSDDQFSLLLNEAKSLAWAELKQTPHAKAEKSAMKNWSHLAKTRSHIPSGKFYSGAHARDLTPNFGRK